MQVPSDVGLFALKMVGAFILCSTGGFLIGWFLHPLTLWMGAKIGRKIPRPVAFIVLVIVSYFWTSFVWKIFGLHSRIFFW